jgi:hypothetical protein
MYIFVVLIRKYESSFFIRLLQCFHDSSSKYKINWIELKICPELSITVQFLKLLLGPSGIFNVSPAKQFHKQGIKRMVFYVSFRKDFKFDLLLDLILTFRLLKIYMILLHYILLYLSSGPFWPLFRPTGNSGASSLSLGQGQ